MNEEEIKSIMEEYKVTREEAIKISENRTRGHEAARKLEVSIDTKNIENMASRLKEAESDAKGFRQIATKLAKNLQSEGLEVDSSEINVDNYLDYIQKLSTQREFNKIRSSTEEKRALYDAEPSGKGGSGQAILSLAEGTKGKEYESHEALIQDLREKSHSEDPEIKREAQAVLSELFKKSSRGFIEQEKGSTIYEDKSTIPLTEQLNKPYRERVMKKLKEKKKEGESS